jgi:hypothetical protein
VQQKLLLHTWPEGQALPAHDNVPPQASEIDPHAFALLQVDRTQQELLRQGSPEGQLPHDRVPPQLSEIVPHSAFLAVHVVGVQQKLLLGLHVSPEGQALPAHDNVPPQPSEIVPQAFASLQVVYGIQQYPE